MSETLDDMFDEALRLEQADDEVGVPSGLRTYEIEEVIEPGGLTYQRRVHRPDGRNVSTCEAELALYVKDARIKELESRLEPCDVCGSIDCEDSTVEYYLKRWKETEAALAEKDARIKELESMVGRAHKGA